MNGNEPAFPSYIEADKGQFSEAKGMTLRAWMATKILAGLLASERPEVPPITKNIAKNAVSLTDALIVELNDPQN